MRTITPDGKLWVEQSPAGKSVRIGITEDYHRTLGVVWNLILRDGAIQEGRPFATAESSKCLVSFYSPVKGTIVNFNMNLVEHPDTLNPDDFIVQVAV